MIYYRVAIRSSQSATWRWKSGPHTSLHPILGVLNMYRGQPKEYIRVFLSTSPEKMEEMLNRANQGLPSTAITVEQIWESRCVNWFEVRRLEIELGAGGDHDKPYTWNVPPSNPDLFAWSKLLARRGNKEFDD